MTFIRDMDCYTSFTDLYDLGFSSNTAILSLVKLRQIALPESLANHIL